jgi:hypothetical protein
MGRKIMNAFRISLIAPCVLLANFFDIASGLMHWLADRLASDEPSAR